MTITTTPSEIETALDRLYSIAQDVDADDLVEFYDGATPSDRPFMELCESSIDLDRSDLDGSAVRELRDIAKCLNRLADAIEAGGVVDEDEDEDGDDEDDDDDDEIDGDDQEVPADAD